MGHGLREAERVRDRRELAFSLRDSVESVKKCGAKRSARESARRSETMEIANSTITLDVAHNY